MRVRKRSNGREGGNEGSRELDIRQAEREGGRREVVRVRGNEGGMVEGER